jgi:hypothetical protein
MGNLILDILGERIKCFCIKNSKEIPPEKYPLIKRAIEEELNKK